jgi:hypothetical protein
MGWKVDLIGLPKATRWPQVTDGVIYIGKGYKLKKVK